MTDNLKSEVAGALQKRPDLASKFAENGYDESHVEVGIKVLRGMSNNAGLDLSMGLIEATLTGKSDDYLDGFKAAGDIAMNVFNPKGNN